MATAGATFAALNNYAVPFLGMVLGWAALGEPIAAASWAGFALALVGVVLTGTAEEWGRGATRQSGSTLHCPLPGRIVRFSSIDRGNASAGTLSVKLHACDNRICDTVISNKGFLANEQSLSLEERSRDSDSRSEKGGCHRLRNNKFASSRHDRERRNGAK